MDVVNLAVLICGIALAWQVYWRRNEIFHYIISKLVFPIRNEQGNAIRGPQWTFSDGQGIIKFLRGHEVSKAWRQYGPVYRIWSGLISEIVLTRPEDVKVFHSDSSAHEKAKSSNGGFLFHQLLGDCMGLINGEIWKKVRASFSSYFAHRTVVETSPRLRQAVTEYIESLSTEEDGSIQLQAGNTARFPFMTTAEYIYGPLKKSEQDELWALGQRNLALMGTVLSGGIYRSRLYPLFKPQTHRRFSQFELDWEFFNRRIYQSRKSHDPQPPIVHIWESLVEAGCSKKELIQTMSEVLFANLDVATHVLGWLVIFIAQDKNIQRQLREEKSNSPSLTEYVMRKDSLLHFCFLESLRLRPFTECSPQVKILGGNIIPPYTSVVVDTLAINHNRDFWGDNSLDFNPHRLEKLSSIELRYNLFTFGFGSRKCLGQYFAEAMAKQFVCGILDGYELQLPENERLKGLHEKASKDTWVPISDLRVCLTPKKRNEHNG